MHASRVVQSAAIVTSAFCVGVCVCVLSKGSIKLRARTMDEFGLEQTHAHALMKGNEDRSNKRHADRQGPRTAGGRERETHGDYLQESVQVRWDTKMRDTGAMTHAEIRHSTLVQLEWICADDKIEIDTRLACSLSRVECLSVIFGATRVSRF